MSIVIEGHSTRCCRDTVTSDAPETPTEGMEIPCRWCCNDILFTEGVWRVRSFFRIERESSPAETLNRHDRANNITDRRFAELMEKFHPPHVIPCYCCSQRSVYKETNADGVALYECINQHKSFVDNSREAGLR